MVWKSGCTFRKLFFDFYPSLFVFAGNSSPFTFSFLHPQSGEDAYHMCITQWDSLVLNLQLMLTTIISLLQEAHFAPCIIEAARYTSHCLLSIVCSIPLPFQITQRWLTPPGTIAVPWHGFLRYFVNAVSFREPVSEERHKHASPVWVDVTSEGGWCCVFQGQALDDMECSVLLCLLAPSL